MTLPLASPALAGLPVQILLEELQQADSLERVAALAEQGRTACRLWLREYPGPRLLAAALSALSDGVTRRVIGLSLAEFDLPQAPWCWLAFGSEGREEQTFATDQDNGLVFSAADAEEAELLRQRFLPFAQTVNRRLDACGYRLCKGDVMAGNPDCCRSVEEWQAAFQDWLRRPEPEALLNATIFFDLRPLYGVADLAEALLAYIAGHGDAAPAFIHLLTENALAAEPPLGLLGELSEREGGLDLKKYGARLFVDGARILALAAGVRRADTVGRLEQAAAAEGRGEAAAADSVRAFLYLQDLRLRTQADGSAQGNLVRADRLSELDHAFLKAAFRQARALQHRLRARHGFVH